MRKFLLFIVIAIFLASTLSSKVFAQFDELQIYTPEEPTQFDTPLTQKIGSIKGKVVSSGKPLSNASIILSNGINAVTDFNGEYEINNLEAGVYGIEIFKEGYKPAHGNVVVTENEKRSVLIDLSKINSSVRQTRNKRTNSRLSQRPEYTTMNIKVYPTRDLTGGYHNYGKLWWVYSINVEDKDGNGKWNETYSKPHHGDGFGSAVKELFCRDAIKGHTYRIEIEWRSFRGSDSKTRYWDETLDIEDKNFIYDCPSGY